MADRPMHPAGAEIAAQAYDAFEAWLASKGDDLDHLTLLEQIEVYYAEYAALTHEGRK